MLLDRQHVDGAEPFDRQHQVIELRLQGRRIALHLLRLAEQRLERSPPLALESFANPLDSTRELLALELQRVSSVRGRSLLGPGLAHTPLGPGQLLADGAKRLVSLPQLGLGLGTLLE